MTSDDYCAEKILIPGSALYYSRLGIPMAQRPAVTALRAFHQEMRETAAISDPGVARLKLRWWREELQRLYAGGAEHPITRALQETVRRHNLPRQEFLDVTEAVHEELQTVHYATYDELEANVRRSAGNVERLVARILGATDDDTLRYAERLGAALHLTEVLQNVARDAERGRLYLPHDDLDRHGLTLDHLTSPDAEEALQPLVRDWVARLQQQFTEAEAALPRADRQQQRAGLILAAMQRGVLREIARQDYRILTRRIELTPLHRLWLTWRTVWRERLRF